jgi:hypothetical protein|eukprot:COSAG02_NODE_2770_length_8061_cov_7.055639_5_plen_79_part_00
MMLLLRNELVPSLRPAFEHLVYAAWWMFSSPRPFYPCALVRHQLTESCPCSQTNRIIERSQGPHDEYTRSSNCGRNDK